MASDADKKGKLLEEAVEVIERYLLTRGGTLKNSDLLFERRKKIVKDGATYEIDLHITVKRDHGYASVFIFECKNWKEKVGRKEITEFAEKIAVSRAQRGFFIAPAFTADAIARGEQDPRMELVTAAAEELQDLETVDAFHVLVVDFGSSKTDVRFKKAHDSDPEFGEDGDLESEMIVNGVSMTVKEYVYAWRKEAETRRSNRFHSEAVPPGDYPLVAEESRTFAPGEIMFRGVEQTSATIRVEYVAHVALAIIQATVEVTGRGITLKLEPIARAGNLQIWLSGDVVAG